MTAGGRKERKAALSMVGARRVTGLRWIELARINRAFRAFREGEVIRSPRCIEVVEVIVSSTEW